MTVTLAATWLPRGEFIRFQRFLPRLHAIYEDMIVVLPPDVDAQMFEALDEMAGVHPVGMSRLGEGRHLAVQKALETDATYIQYCDMDRLIRWVETRPEELQATVDQIQSADYVLIGRTEAAFATHPLALQKTETIIHGVFSNILGGDYDFCAGSKGLSRAAAVYVVEHADPHDASGTDVTWAVLLHQAGYTISGCAVDGLDWETADRFRDEAADDALQQEQAAAYDANPESWKTRTDLAWRIIRSGLSVVER